MAKKNAFTKGGNKTNFKKHPFKVNAAAQKTKKAKAVKTNVKKLKANVSSQQESADTRLKALHEQMVVKKPAPKGKKINLVKPEKKSTPNTKAVQSNLEQMSVN